MTGTRSNVAASTSAPEGPRRPLHPRSRLHGPLPRGLAFHGLSPLLSTVAQKY